MSTKKYIKETDTIKQNIAKKLPYNKVWLKRTSDVNISSISVTGTIPCIVLLLDIVVVSSHLDTRFMLLRFSTWDCPIKMKHYNMSWTWVALSRRKWNANVGVDRNRLSRKCMHSSLTLPENKHTSWYQIQYILKSITPCNDATDSPSVC